MRFNSPLFHFAIILLMSFGVQSVYAQDENAKTKGKVKNTTINFEDQLIQGKTQKPELFYLLQNRNPNLKRLIRLRENFLPEMERSMSDI